MSSRYSYGPNPLPISTGSRSETRRSTQGASAASVVTVGSLSASPRPHPVRDLSWEAEDQVIRAAAATFADLPAEVEIRNEARVRLWCEQKFGVPCAPYTSTEAAIDSFAATTCCLDIRLEAGGRWRVDAPHGLSDVFRLVVRPNPVLAPRAVYEAKAARWRRQWPELTVLRWPTVRTARAAKGCALACARMPVGIRP